MTPQLPPLPPLPPPTPSPTTSPQWLAAWGTVGGATATIVTVVLAFFALRGELLRANEQRDLDRRERRHRDAAQARTVLTVAVAVLPPHRDSLSGTHRAGEVHVTLTNHSQLPLLEAFLDDVWLRVRIPRAPYEEVRPEWRGWDFDAEYEPETGPIPGGAQRHWRVVFPAAGSSHDPDHATIRRVVTADDTYLPTVVFTDAAGLRWRRTDTWQPELVLDPDPAPEHPGATK